ncbi:hypothetical protein N7495_004119 [Penicillium taxi]|uniref:uncharacterized protein n=1 Tax=Penicillium taxi TaxID=168475 RepID=UPI002544DEEE|nr:uncharacterized protein N7495_004119 [Penicillium taxi]KAJ5899375.1 hypothetical protein N7495_004119 [Penicillium taxi]
MAKTPEVKTFAADFVIIGGGTAGLVLAARLSEDPKTVVIVIESGPDCTDDPLVQNPENWPKLQKSDVDWNFQVEQQVSSTEFPLQPENQHPAGRMLGGSSALNGMVFLPPSPAGIDAWAKLGNPNWNWESIRPYLLKSYSVTAPKLIPEMDLGESKLATGPIQVSYPALEDRENHPLLEAWCNALRHKGYDYVEDILSERKTIGSRAFSATIDPASGLRSSANSTYGSIIANRPNVVVYTNTTAVRIHFDHLSASTVEVKQGTDNNGLWNTMQFSARKEIILAAGALQSPKLLQLSGVGCKHLLAKHDIHALVDLPGVGENLQNHLMMITSTPLKSHIEPGFKALAMTRISPEEQKKLLCTYPVPKTESEKVLKSIIEDSNEATASFFLSTSDKLAHFGLVTSYPFTRGTVKLNDSIYPFRPATIDFKFSHPLDKEMLAYQFRDLQNLIHSEQLREFVRCCGDSDDSECKKDQHGPGLLKEYTSQVVNMAHHACGTAAMLPRDDGGVVDQNLFVYGTRKLRVVDASIFPIIPHGNPIATVYAVAERAADIIKDAHNIPIPDAPTNALS